MKKPNGNYCKMPNDLITDYQLSAGELYLYYVLKQFEERFYNADKGDQFWVSDQELIKASKMSHNTMAKYKRALKQKGLIRVRKRKDNCCDYLLLELYKK